MADPTRARLVFSAALLTAVVVGGGTAFWLLVGETYSFFDSIYFALITVSTVGYSELPRMELHPPARIVVMTLIVAGVVAVALFQSSMTAVLVEGVIGRAFRKRRMEKRILALKSHTIVAGCGRTGRFVVQELTASRLPFVVVEKDPEMFARLNLEYNGELLHVIGDATDDHVLTAAGVERAWGLVTALAEDPENVFVTISARSLNPRVRIVAKAVTLGSEAKLMRAGANATVSPHRIGALRLVTELLRPHTAEFLDSMMRGTGEEQLRFDDVEVCKGGKFEGRSLREAPIREEANVLIVAIRGPDGRFVYNPPADSKLEQGSYVVVLGTRDGVSRLRQMVGDPG
ncbi:MAG TPA: potassium channel protein [Polyangiaceae bacterium]|nr:potassium channel protein [Polyangiaceae bacterium]